MNTGDKQHFYTGTGNSNSNTSNGNNNARNTGTNSVNSGKQKNKNKKKSRPQSVVGFDTSTSPSNNNLNYSVSATTSKPRPPLPPNQNKKVNNKKQKQKERRAGTVQVQDREEQRLQQQQQQLPNRLDTPISTSSSDSSVARALMNNMNLDDFTGIEYTDSSCSSSGEQYNYSDDSDDLMTGDYIDLPADDLILNTESVDKIIEQIVTDIEDLNNNSEDSDDSNEDDEFGEEDANAGVKRYFIENSGPKCFNCGQSGHVVRDCPADSTVPCHLCGQIGHSRYNCPQEVCYNCSRPGHQSKACPGRRKRRVYDDDLCNRCGQPGHLSRECSMSWRGYVFSRDLPQKQASFLEELRGLRKRCYNCASISHFGDDCPNRRRSNYSTFHIPQYDYLDRVILRIKRAETKKDKHVIPEKSNAHVKSSSERSSSVKPEKVEQSIKVKADRPAEERSNKIKINNKVQHSTTQHHQNNINHTQSQSSNQNRKVFIESRGHATQPKEDFDDFSVYDNDGNYDHQQPQRSISSHPQNQSPLKRHKEDEEEGAVPFLRYEQNHVRVNRRIDDGEEDNLRKGSSSLAAKKQSNYSKPSYRGGYK